MLEGTLRSKNIDLNDGINDGCLSRFEPSGQTKNSSVKQERPPAVGGKKTYGIFWYR